MKVRKDYLREDIFNLSEKEDILSVDKIKILAETLIEITNDPSIEYKKSKYFELEGILKEVHGRENPLDNRTEIYNLIKLASKECHEYETKKLKNGNK